MPARLKENSKNGLFDASGWKPLPSGLLGPVTLSALKERRLILNHKGTKGAKKHKELVKLCTLVVLDAPKNLSETLGLGVLVAPKKP